VAGLGWRRRAQARARASVRASAVVVEVVGAGRPKDCTSDVGMGAGRRIERWAGRAEKRGQVDGWVWEVNTIKGRLRLRCGMRERSSGVRPENVRSRNVSFLNTQLVNHSGVFHELRTYGSNYTQIAM